VNSFPAEAGHRVALCVRPVLPTAPSLSSTVRFICTIDLAPSEHDGGGPPHVHKRRVPQHFALNV
jgi:hypothetical protein